VFRGGCEVNISGISSGGRLTAGHGSSWGSGSFIKRSNSGGSGNDSADGEADKKEDSDDAERQSPRASVPLPLPPLQTPPPPLASSTCVIAGFFLVDVAKSSAAPCRFEPRATDIMLFNKDVRLS